MIAFSDMSKPQQNSNSCLQHRALKTASHYFFQGICLKTAQERYPPPSAHSFCSNQQSTAFGNRNLLMWGRIELSQALYWEFLGVLPRGSGIRLEVMICMRCGSQVRKDRSRAAKNLNEGTDIHSCVFATLKMYAQSIAASRALHNASASPRVLLHHRGSINYRLYYRFKRVSALTHSAWRSLRSSLRKKFALEDNQAGLST